MKVKLTIDGKEVVTRPWKMVLEAALEAGIYIPHLCWHRLLEPFGGCRICLVEVEGVRGFPASCTTPVREGMVVKTSTPEVIKQRQNILELLLSEHPMECLMCWKEEICGPLQTCIRSVHITERCVTCPQNYRCELQAVSEIVTNRRSKAFPMKLPYKYRELPVLDSDPFYDRDYNLCIVCARCVRVCDERVGAQAIGMMDRGGRTLPGTAFNVPLTQSGCVFCGACVDVCPTGALTERAYKFQGPQQGKQGGWGIPQGKGL